MDSLSRDVSRLDLILNLSVGQERLSPALHFKDFLHYYFTRFVSNVQHVFKDFKGSEIEDFNRRHASKIAFLNTAPAIQLNDLIVFIPKGMIQPYKQTTKALLDILAKVAPDQLAVDLQALLDHMASGTIKDLTLQPYDKVQFDKAKIDIGKLFGKTGLLHSTGAHVLVSKADIVSVNTTLLDTTKTCYPTILSLNQMIKTVEGQYAKSQLSEQDKLVLSGHFMTLAYRLSIFATVMEHVQQIEHAFTKSLDIVLQKIA